MPESAWGWLIITYLFLAGAGAGAFLAAVACDLLAPDWSKALGTGRISGRGAVGGSGDRLSRPGS